MATTSRRIQKPSSQTGTVENEPPEQEYVLLERNHLAVSRWWKSTMLICYFTIVLGGLGTSVAIGNITGAFQLQCILYAEFNLTDLNDFNGTVLTKDDIQVLRWGNSKDCYFCTFCPVASAIFGVLWGTFFLQCGRGGNNPESASQAWRIVPLAFLSNFVWLILSCIIISKTVGGLSGFCYHILEHQGNSFGYDSQENITRSCTDVFSFSYPWDNYNTPLYTNYIISLVGSSLTFVGWCMAFFILLVRVLTLVDFVVMTRKPIVMRRSVGTSCFDSTSLPSSDDSEEEELRPLQRRSEIKTMAKLKEF